LDLGVVATQLRAGMVTVNDRSNPDLATLRSFFLVSGIFNALAIVAAFFWIPLVGLATCGFGCVLVVLPVLNTVAAVMDFVALTRLDGSAENPAGFLRAAAILDIVAGFLGSMIPLVFGILELIYLGKPEVQAALERRGP
jgi:hypothetical protein